MKKFKFTMQTLLNVKLTLEKQKMGELSACNARIQELERQQEGNYARQQQQNTQYTRLLEEGLPVAEASLWRVAFLTLRERIAAQATLIENTYDERTRIQDALLAVMRERKMLEKLREKQQEEYKTLQKAEDAAAVDEFLSHKVFEGVESVG